MTDFPEVQTIEDADCSPYIAMTAGKASEELAPFFERFSQLSSPVRSFMTSLDVIERIKQMLLGLHVPPTHTIAISKIIAFTAMGDVSISNIEPLLTKLNLSEPLAHEVGDAITGILEPIIAERARVSVPQGMPELPPMTMKIPPIAPGPDSSKTTARNIIDLRTKT